MRPINMIPRMIYTGIMVKDMEESIKFYTNVLGMRLHKDGYVALTL